VARYTGRTGATTGERDTRTSDDVAGNPPLDRLEAEDGRRLRELACDLVWATTWAEEANEIISPRLGLAQLPVVLWPGHSARSDPRPRLGDYCRL
jgi:hypothetical protein